MKLKECWVKSTARPIRKNSIGEFNFFFRQYHQALQDAQTPWRTFVVANLPPSFSRTVNGKDPGFEVGLLSEDVNNGYYTSFDDM